MVTVLLHSDIQRGGRSHTKFTSEDEDYTERSRKNGGNDQNSDDESPKRGVLVVCFRDNILHKIRLDEDKIV